VRIDGDNSLAERNEPSPSRPEIVMIPLKEWAQRGREEVLLEHVLERVTRPRRRHVKTQTSRLNRDAGGVEP